MTTISIQDFGLGMADDNFGGRRGEFSIAKHFDVLTFPNRLHPLRGMGAESVTNSKIGNIIIASDGLMYGVGEDPSNPGTSGKLWQRSGYGGSDVWQSIPSNNQISGQVYKSPFLVEFKDVGTTPATDRTIFWASAGFINNSNMLGANGINQQALSFTRIGQGFVHQQYKNLYIPYDNFIRNIPFGSATLSSVLLTLPTQYQIPCLTNYGNFLAIPAFSANGIGVSGSMVYLWDTTSTTWNESISWGQGQLKVLNNLNGVLIGISTASGNSTGSVQDADSILIKTYSGGTEPVLIKEIVAQHFAGASAPSVSINPNVNFIYKNRLYFSVNIVPNDGVSNSYYGLWSIGKNRQGNWVVNMERVATNANTETGVLAAAISGDFVSMAHTADGTLTFSNNGQTSSTTYSASSVYESVVNPEMSNIDNILKKQLMAVSIQTLPLTSGQQIVVKYRVDTSAAFTTVFTKTSTSPDTNLTAYESSKPSSGQFKQGRNYEFQITSTGGAEPIGFSYSYITLKTNIKS